MANKAVTDAASKGGIGIGTVCFIVFLIMKLAKIAPIASWSWIKVILLPVLISFVPTIIVLLLSLIGLLITFIVIKTRK